jgi:hypothetical protein
MMTMNSLTSTSFRQGAPAAYALDAFWAFPVCVLYSIEITCCATHY